MSVSVVPFEANRVIQIQPSVAATKKRTHTTVNIVDDGMTSQNTLITTNLRSKGGPNRLSKENRRSGMQLQKGTTQCSTSKVVLKD
ncbi:hypothetical protein V6N13_106808 [Hibiscus sabdariffa]